MTQNSARDLLLRISDSLSEAQRTVAEALRALEPNPAGEGAPTCLYCGEAMVGKRSDARVCDAAACRRRKREGRPL